MADEVCESMGECAGAGRPRMRFSATCVVGLGCLVAWTYVTFFSKLVHFSTRNDITHLNSTYTFACCGIIAVTLLAALLERRRAVVPQGGACDRVVRRASLFGAAAALVLFVCTVVLALVERGLFTQPWCNIASTLAGCCVGVLFLGWAHVSSLDCERSTARLACAFVFAACVFVAVLYLPDILALALTALLPPASLLCLHVASRGLPPCPEPGEIPRAAVAPLRRGVATCAMLGFAESLMRALYLEINPIADTEVYRWMMLLAAVLGAGLVLAASRTGSGWASGAGLTRVSMFVMALLFGAAPVVRGLGIAADLAVSVCYVIVNLVLWTTMAQIAAAFRLSSTRVFGIGLGLVYVGFLTGTFTGDVITSFVSLDGRAWGALSLLSMALVLAALLFVVDERTVVVLLNADDAQPAAPERFAQRCEEVANAYGLSPKETQVMALAAHGRTNQRIQEALGISAGTVNTHLTRIYKKLGIHSRQEMLDLVEGEG